MTGIILSGGKNTRMGFNKAFVSVGGERIIDRTVNLFRELFNEIIIVTNNPADYEDLDVLTVADVVKDVGSIGGIYTGLFHASSEYSFIAACDMPFLNKELILKMIEISSSSGGGWTAVVPFAFDRYHPLHAIYSRKCMKPIEEMIKNSDLRIANLFQKIKIKRLEEAEWFSDERFLSSLDNINTKEDLDRANRLTPI